MKVLSIFVFMFVFLGLLTASPGYAATLFTVVVVEGNLYCVYDITRTEDPASENP